MQLFFNTILLSFFNQISHPLTLGLILILQTIFSTILIGLISPSFWFSYILFLIFVGGMLILFIYTISIISNEKFNFILNKNFFMMIITIFILILLMKFNKLNFSFMLNPDLSLLNKEQNLKLESSIFMNKFFNYPNNIITLMMMIYLFFLLIISVYLTNFL